MKRARRSDIDSFFSSHAIAVIGVSESKKKFGNIVYCALRDHKFEVYPINPHRKSVEGVTCYPSLLQLPVKVESAITLVPPRETENVIQDCVQHGIKVLWMQTGSESEHAIAEAEANGIKVISKECVLMFLEPVSSIHGVHRFFKRVVGAYPH